MFLFSFVMVFRSRRVRCVEYSSCIVRETREMNKMLVGNYKQGRIIYVKMDFREIGYDNIYRIHLVTIMMQHCTLRNRIIIPSACITDGVCIFTERHLAFQGGFRSMELAAVVTFWYKCQSWALSCTLCCEINLAFDLSALP
jgi:hypothetical protein